MLVLNEATSNNLRAKYIDCFINVHSDYFVNRINSIKEFNDGWCYTGYLWDCFCNASYKSEQDCEMFLKGRSNLYIFWDIHSSERIFVPNYWKYPKRRVLFCDLWNRSTYLPNLPEDIYFFDDSFSWSIAYTHEESAFGDRICYFANHKIEKATTGDLK